MKTTIIKSPTYVSISRLEVTEEVISELGRPKKIIQNSDQNRNIKMTNNSKYDRLRDMKNKARCNIFLMRVPKGDNREMERDNI